MSATGNNSNSNDPKDFRDQILQGFWIDLKDHQERNAIIIVDESLDLVEVANAVAGDDAKIVQGWIVSGKLTRPTPEQLAAWNAMQAKEFRFVIAQPYVLVQEAEH